MGVNMSEEEKKDEETPETPDTPDTPDTPETPEPESPEAETPAEETPAEEPAAEEPKAEESPAEETTAEPAPEPASTPSAPLPAPAGPNKGILFARIGGVALLLVLIIICACCLIWNPFSSGGAGEGQAKSLANKVVTAFKNNKPDDLKKYLTTRDEFIEHSKEVEYKHLTELEEIRMHSEEEFNKMISEELKKLNDRVPSTRKVNGEDVDLDEITFTNFKKQFDQYHTELKWNDAKVEKILWDFEEAGGLKQGPVLIRMTFGDTVGILVLSYVTYSKVTGEFGWGRPGGSNFVFWRELKKAE